MEVNKKTKITLGLIFLIIPVIHIILIIYISADIKDELYNFVSVIAGYFNMSIRDGNYLVLSLFSEVILFLFISMIFFKPGKNHILKISILILIFIAINIALLVFNLIPSYLYYAIPLAAVVFSLVIIIFLATRTIRGSSFLINKLKMFKPYFRHDCSINSVIAKKGVNSEALLKNISLSGCMLSTGEPLFFNDYIDIAFKVNDYEIKARGWIVRKIYPEKAGSCCEYGVRFVKIEKHGKKTLKDYLKKL